MTSIFGRSILPNKAFFNPKTRGPIWVPDIYMYIYIYFFFFFGVYWNIEDSHDKSLLQILRKNFLFPGVIQLLLGLFSH